MSEEKALPWSEDEIIRHYRTAKDQAAIIPILADLNAVPQSRIRQVLRRHGIKTDTECRTSRRYETVREEKPLVRKKETKPRRPKVYIVLEHDGTAYSVEDIARGIGRSVTYVKARIKDVDAVTFGGVEYKITRYEKWGRNCGLCGEITAGIKES